MGDITQLRETPPLNDLAGSLRWLADQVEARAGEITTVVVVLETRADSIEPYAYGEPPTTSAAAGMLLRAAARIDRIP